MVPKVLDDVQFYPLMWPSDRPRTPAPKREKGTWNVARYPEAIGTLERELGRSKIGDYRLSMDVRPHSAKEANSDPGAALWFNKRQRDRWVLSVLASDRYTVLAQNIRAIELTLQRIRLISEYGCYTFDQAIEGAAYKALPPPDQMRAPRLPEGRSWWEVLGCREDDSPEVVEAVYKAKRAKAHPDRPGGSTAAFQEIEAAWATAQRGAP